MTGLCVLINTGVLGWGMLKKGIDWEFLIYLGATLSIPSLLTKAKLDEWLSGFLAPFVLPFVDQPAIAFIIIALIGYALKLVFTSRLVVITLVVALSALSQNMGISPWVMTDHPYGGRGLVLPFSGRLAHDGLRHNGREGFYLPAHVSDQSSLRPCLHPGSHRGHSLLEISGTHRVKSILDF